MRKVIPDKYQLSLTCSCSSMERDKSATLSPLGGGGVYTDLAGVEDEDLGTGTRVDGRC